MHIQNLRLRCQPRYLITYEINNKPSESNGHTTQLRQYLTHAPRENRSFSVACAQPYHQGSGSHGQLFRPCWSSSAWHSQRVNDINTQGWKKKLGLEGVEGRGKGGGGCILKIVISEEGKGGGTIFVCNYLGGKVLIYHTFLKTPAPPPRDIIYDRPLMSVALFVVTEPPTHQLIKSADTVPPLRNSLFFSPSPSKRKFSLIPQNHLKDQRRRLSDPLRNNFRSPTVLICIYIHIVTCFFIWRLILINSIYM